MEHSDEIQRIADILDIDTKFVEIKNTFVYIGKVKKNKKFPLNIDKLRDLLRRAHYHHFENFIFRNFKIKTSNNKIIKIRNDKAIKDCEFYNCEFDDFHIQSLQVGNLTFSNCVFETLEISNCQIVNLSLEDNKITKSFLLDNSKDTSLTSKDNKEKTSLTINYIETNSITIIGTLLQISLSNINTKKLNFRFCKIQSALTINKDNKIDKFLMSKSEINGANFEDIGCEDIEIQHCIFKKSVYFPKICKKINIRKSEFEKVYSSDVYFDEVRFYQNTFKDELDFKTCQFEKNAHFSNNTFQKNAYFNNSIFKGYGYFGECKFEQRASFYGVTFEKTPNFSQAIFKGDLNIVNTNLNFDFEDLELRIKKEFEEYNKNKEDTKALQNFANDFRDSFRIFKSVLVANHNVLNALDFRRAELYCKEVELKAKYNERHIEGSSEIEMRKNTRKFKERVDYLLLCFYRKLCEHHTDFLRVFNNLILLIALYALFAYLGNFDELVNENNSLKKYLDIFLGLQMWLNDNVCIVFILLSSIFVVLGIYKAYKNGNLSFAKIFLKQLFSKSLKTDMKKMGIFIILIICALLASCIFILKEMDIVSILLNIALFLSFVFSYLWLVLLNNIIFRYIFIIYAYLLNLVFIIGCGEIVILHPIIGKIIDNNGVPTNPSLSLLTLAYTILMILVLFSLQKTARKNSIVPS